MFVYLRNGETTKKWWRASRAMRRWLLRAFCSSLALKDYRLNVLPSESSDDYDPTLSMPLSTLLFFGDLAKRRP